MTSDSVNGTGDPSEVVPSLRGLADEELAVQIQQGCRPAFEELVDRYGPRLLRFLVRRAGSLHDAEDLVQETFVRVHCYISRYRPDYGFSTWLYTIASRLASNHRRRARVSPACTNREAPIDPSPLDQVCQREDSANLWRIAKTLAEGQHEVLWLRYAEAMTIQEIARVTRRSQVHVRVLLFRARLGMARKIQAAEEGSCPQPSTTGSTSPAEMEGD
jgi:RNA polymerase sigma-70 factor, ECF subfamily